MTLRRLVGAIVAIVNADSCASTDLIGPWCTAANGTLKVTDQRATCVKDNTVVGISYAHCNNDHIPHDDDLANVTWIDFRQAECTYSDKDTSVGDLYGTGELDTLIVAKSCAICPGQFRVNNYTLSINETFSPWGAADFQTNDYGVCTEPVSFCNFNKTNQAFNGYYCPENSVCLDNGIGAFDCQETGGCLIVKD